MPEVWWYSCLWDLGTFAQFQGSKMSSGLFQDLMDGYIEYYNFSL